MCPYNEVVTVLVVFNQCLLPDVSRKERRLFSLVESSNAAFETIGAFPPKGSVTSAPFCGQGSEDVK